MPLESWPQSQKHRWTFLKKVASGISGRFCEVVPGYGAPSAVCVPPHLHFSRIQIPPSFSGASLDGALAHEILHVMGSSPKAFSGIAWGVFLLANSLEDARVEAQLGPRWVGLKKAIDQALMEIAEFRVRERLRASSVWITQLESLRIAEVGIALYWLLSGFPSDLLKDLIHPMAFATAKELLPLAKPALEAPDSFVVVEIAKKILEELVRAAEKAAAKAGSSSSWSWVSRLRAEVEKAKTMTVEDVLIGHRMGTHDGAWWDGPWCRGFGGGYSFYSSLWSWEPASPPLVRALSAEELLDLLEEADPTKEITRVSPPSLHGVLMLSAQNLVKAALGKERRIFLQDEERRAPLLPHLLGQTEIIIFVEAHRRINPAQQALLKSVVTSLGRLCSIVGVPLFAVRAATCVRKKERVEDPETKKVWERWTNEIYVKICAIKPPDVPWTTKAEEMIATIPFEGFNNPLEAYHRMQNWNLTLPNTRRMRVFVCLGDAMTINVAIGHLKYATESLRGNRKKAIYVNVGSPLTEYAHQTQLEDFKRAFDAIVQGDTVSEILIRFLHALLEILA